MRYGRFLKTNFCIDRAFPGHDCASAIAEPGDGPNRAEPKILCRTRHHYVAQAGRHGQLYGKVFIDM